MVPEPIGGSLVVRAFSLRRVLALTGLSRWRLQYWEKVGLVRPSLSVRRGHGSPRLYSFRDLVELRVAAALRQDGVSLQKIRRVVDHLRRLDYARPLAELRFWSHAGELYFSEAETVRAGRRPEQVVMTLTVPVQAIVDRLQAEIERLDRRQPGAIERRRGTMGSRPVLVGTRIPIASIRRLAEDGLSDREILGEYPDLTVADVREALSVDPPRRRTGSPAS